MRASRGVNQPQRILLVRLSHLGDVVHALPVFHAARARFPAARIAWVTQPEFAPLLEGMPGLERVFRFGRDAGAAAWPQLATELASFSADLVIDAQGNLKSAAAALCAGPARRTGLARSEWREPLGACVLSDSAPASGGGDTHAMDRMLVLARHVCETDEIALRTDPALSLAELDAGERALEALLPRAGRAAGGEPDVLLALTAPDDVRSWPVERCVELARTLSERGARVLVLSGPAEIAAGDACRDALGEGPNLRHWVGQRGLRELAGLFTAAARAGATLVACDSGPMHLAAACGLRVVSLSGPQSHHRTGPWPVPGSPLRLARHAVVRSPSPPACAPCFDRLCSHPNGPVCMREIGAPAVLAALGGAY
jgi:ADP-heptose:LPS heptosyltransferase